MRSLMLLLVSSNSILFQHLFFLILEHRIHFISKAFVDRNGFPTENIGCPIKVSSPGGDMIVSLGCRDLVIEFGKHKFPVSLIILDSQGLHVILGMDWMAKYEGVLDCANRTVALTTPEKKRIRFKSNF